MNVTPRTTVGEIASAMPRAIPVFQKHGIDFCCGGRRALAEICSEKGVPFDAILGEITSADRAPGAPGADWEKEPFRALIAHIIGRYHAGLREELPRLSALAEKVASVHGARHPDTLPALRDTFHTLRNELEPHLEKEERVLFPTIEGIEAASLGLHPLPGPPLGSVIAAMEREHEIAGLALTSLRRLTGNYRPPDDACASVRALYAGLEIFEADLKRHIHLENNVLFPRAAEMARRIADR